MDLVGLACSLYKRGIPYIKIPTTLLGMVDAGIGVKTAINYQNKKSEIGSYYAPIAVFNDKSFLKSLPARQISNGLAEILKIALTKNKKLFVILEKYSHKLIASNFQQDGLSDEVISRSISGMLKELESNLWERKLERKVDYGHTFSPLIEMSAHPRLLHGEAVAIDMAFSSILSYMKACLTKQELRRILKVIRKMHLPIYHPVCQESLFNRALVNATLHRDGRQRVPLTIGIGKTKFFNNINSTEISSSLKYLKRVAKIDE